jgi:hypothetical protein
MANNKQDSSKLGVGVALAAAAAATAAGVYFLSGDRGAKNRKAIKGWALKAKGEVLEKIENLKEVNEETYYKIIDSVAKRYEAMKNVDAEELGKMAAELKSHWKNIQKSLTAKPKKSTKRRSS